MKTKILFLKLLLCTAKQQRGRPRRENFRTKTWKFGSSCPHPRRPFRPGRMELSSYQWFWTGATTALWSRFRSPGSDWLRWGRLISTWIKLYRKKLLHNLRIHHFEKLVSVSCRNYVLTVMPSLVIKSKGHSTHRIDTHSWKVWDQMGLLSE